MQRRFTLEKRERFLALLATGLTQKDACAEVGIRRETVSYWVKIGRKEGAARDKRDFAQRYDEIRNGPSNDTGLTQADLIKILEAKARNGHVQAAKLLLERPWERQHHEAPKDEPKSLRDELAARRRMSA